ncbi:MAG TPA: acetyl-CoA C-acyltransferase [Spirochaetia bacterium]|nr:acetyl-CoA C-acyltransferase [Spirochaetia bacterium]
MREAYVVSAVRTPVGKSGRGKLRNTRPDDLAAAVVNEAIARVAGLDPALIEDLVLGCAFPEAEQGMNAARVVAIRAGLPVTVPGATINRFCASGLEAIAIAATRVMAGMAEIMVAGGLESMSLVPMGGNKPAPNPYVVDNFPAVYMSMGLTAERVAARYGVTRAEQDAFALASHQKAAAAQDAGYFAKEILPVTVEEVVPAKRGVEVKSSLFAADEGVRRETTLEALASLKPVFQAGGSVTAGNSSQTSDGAAAVVVMSGEMVKTLGVKPLAVFRSYAVGGVEPEVMGIGPVVAIPKALKMAGLSVQDLDLVELNEAFASQALAVIRETGLDPARVNVCGGAVALGHPLGCTGAKLTTTLVHGLARTGGRYGLVSMCIGGGMGAAAVLERVG